MTLQKRITVLICVSFLFTASFCAAQSEPVMDYATLLTAFDVRPDGRLQLENDNEPLTAVFLPEDAEAVAVITKAGSESPLHVQDFYKVSRHKVFTLLESRGKYKEFKFTEPGDYVLTYKTGNKVMTRIPFTVIKKSNNDEFEPKTIWFAQGPWSEWAYLYYLRRAGGGANIEFRMWGQRQAFESGRETDKYDVVLKKDGDVIAESRTGHVGTQYWLNLQFKMQNPASKGGRMFTLSELTARDGNYQFVVSRNQNLHAVYNLEVKGGKPVLHPQQASSYQPRDQYIIPRYHNLRAGASDGGDTFWMKRVSDTEAVAAAGSKAAEVAGPTAEQLKRWEWLPRSIDPNRQFKFAVTDIETRTDTGFAVGEDLVVFGVGHPNGVKYMKVGDSTAREIPEGETWSSKVFCVCGNKIVLTKRNAVAVFDTETGKMTKIPTTDISLYDGSYRLMNCDGYLVATVNIVNDVTDRNIIKVIDISGDEPVIIPIKNSNYTHDQVTGIAVDAKHGTVAVVSRHNKMVAAAKVAPLANQHVFDVSEYKGVSDFQIYLDDEVVTYADSDWKVRQLKLGDTPKAVTEEPMGRSGNGFWVRKGRLVTISNNEKVGSRYPVMITDSDATPQRVPGTGTAIKGTSAKLGYGGSVAIAVDKTVFIAGSPGDSIGVGERLQMLTDNGWVPIMGDDGKPIWGSQVETSMGFMAMKVRNAAGKTVIGYATYGERISPPGNNNSMAETKPKNAAPAGTPLQLADDNPYSTHDERLANLLESYLETEKSVGEAYIVAFGKENGAKKTVEGMVKSMKDNGQDELIDDYLRMSAYVDDKDRPQVKTETGGSQSVDKNSVLKFLSGHWQAIRFSAEGKDLPDAAVDALQLTFADGKYVMNMGSELQTGNYEIDTTTSPMSMTIHIGSGDKKGQKRHGSFKPLKDNRLLMVFATNETDSPKRFVPDKSGKSIMAVYQKK